MPYIKTVWKNGPAGPALNKDNLNNLETQYDEAIAELGGEVFGNGSDGVFDSAGNVTLAVPVEDESVIVKQYTSLKLNAGHTLTVDKRCRGLIIKVRGNVTIDGTIDLSGKAANVKPDSGSLALSLKALTYTLPIGGGGGAGGKGGGTYGGAGGAAGVGAWYGGSRGGGGGGGASASSYGENSYDGPGYAGGASNPGYAGAAGGPGAGSNGSGGAGGRAPQYVPGSAGAGGSSVNGGGAGGGGGASIGNGAAGADGTNWGGGLLIIIASGDVSIGANGIVRANGGNGAAGGEGGSSIGGDYAAPGGGGGGGGGAGGGIVAIYHAGAYANGGTVQANGGAGGNGGTTGTGGSGIDGAAGSSGSIGGISIIKVVA